MNEKLASYRKFGTLALAGIVAAIVIVLLGFLWRLCVVTIRPGNIGIVFHERGKEDPDGFFIVEKGYKGIHGKQG